MKDHVSIRITFSEKGADSAAEIIKFLEANFENISFQKPRQGNNPKYKPGGKNYDAEQGEFSLAYSRANIKNGEPLLPKRTQSKGGGYCKKMTSIRLVKSKENIKKSLSKNL